MPGTALWGQAAPEGRPNPSCPVDLGGSAAEGRPRTEMVFICSPLAPAPQSQFPEWPLEGSTLLKVCTCRGGAPPVPFPGPLRQPWAGKPPKVQSPYGAQKTKTEWLYNWFTELKICAGRSGTRCLAGVPKIDFVGTLYGSYNAPVGPL